MSVRGVKCGCGFSGSDLNQTESLSRLAGKTAWSGFSWLSLLLAVSLYLNQSIKIFLGGLSSRTTARPPDTVS